MNVSTLVFNFFLLHSMKYMLSNITKEDKVNLKGYFWICKKVIWGGRDKICNYKNCIEMFIMSKLTLFINIQEIDQEFWDRKRWFGRAVKTQSEWGLLHALSVLEFKSSPVSDSSFTLMCPLWDSGNSSSSRFPVTHEEDPDCIPRCWYNPALVGILGVKQFRISLPFN